MTLITTRYVGSCGHTYSYRHPPDEKQPNYRLLRCEKCRVSKGKYPLRSFSATVEHEPANW